MRVVEAYQIKKQIDQQAFNALALYQTAYSSQDIPPTQPDARPRLLQRVCLASRGGTQEVKHTYTTTYDEVYTTTTLNTADAKFRIQPKFSAGTSRYSTRRSAFTNTARAH